MRLNPILPPALEPVTIAEVQAFLRIDGADENVLLSSLITTARDWAERTSGRAFITQTWEMILDSPDEKAFRNICRNLRYGMITNQDAVLINGFWYEDYRAIEIPRPPLQQIVKIEVIGYDGVKIEVPKTSYMVDLGGENPGRVTLGIGSAWPWQRGFSSFIITLKAGYGDAAADVPAIIKTAILQAVAHLYEHRDDADLDESAAAKTLRKFKVFRL